MSNYELSYVALGVIVCPVCDAQQEKEILLDKNLNPTLPKRVLTGFELCERCSNMERNGYLALVEILPESTKPYQPDTVKKTGRLAHINRGVADEIFSVSIPQAPCSYVEQGVIPKHDSLVDTAPDENPDENPGESTCRTTPTVPSTAR